MKMPYMFIDRVVNIQLMHRQAFQGMNEKKCSAFRDLERGRSAAL